MTEFDLTPKGQQGRVRNFTIDHRFKTDWGILAILLVFTIIFATLMKPVQSVQVSEATNQSTTSMYELENELLDRLIGCESTHNWNAVGDNGKAHGAFQFHETGLEDIMNAYYGDVLGTDRLTHSQFHAIAYNPEEATFWTRYALFELGWTNKWETSFTRMEQGNC